MTLKEELEILRGEPIQVFTGDPMDIPCVETSDSERLCKHPVVSVSMITYNHEPYIRQAIEGVMMQKTDFEFELVIGEDCSTDKTREICFEYQKRYPDKIRVLWCDHNLRQIAHPAGGNSRRNLAHCRGEFIALCEGDDYWIDPLKLQKQVDAMLKHQNVGICFTNGCDYVQCTGKYVHSEKERFYAEGLVRGKEFSLTMVLGMRPQIGHGPESALMTASVMYRKRIFDTICNKYDCLQWRLHLGDLQTWVGLGFNSDVWFLKDETVIYRVTDNGDCRARGSWVAIDAYIVRLYFLNEEMKVPLDNMPPACQQEFVRAVHAAFYDAKNFPLINGYAARFRYLCRMMCNRSTRSVFLCLASLPITIGSFLDLLPQINSRFVVLWRRTFLYYLFPRKIGRKLKSYYEEHWPDSSACVHLRCGFWDAVCRKVRLK